MQEELQTQICQSIYDSKFVNVAVRPHLLWYSLWAADDVVVDSIMGDFGSNFKAIALQADLEHPNFPKILTDHTADTIVEFLDLGKVCVDKKYNRALPHFPKIIKKIIVEELAKVPNWGNLICICKDRVLREEWRSKKKTSPINLSAACGKGESLWFGLPDDFSMYARNSRIFEEQIANIKQKADKYKTLGCDTLCNEIEKSINEFEDNFTQSYYGFHRLKMTDAAVILAKMHGFELVKQGDSYEIITKTQLLQDLVSQKEVVSTYAPIAIPSCLMRLSEPMKKMIDFLEAFPEAGNKPIFDHYIFVVPNVHWFSPPEPERWAEADVFIPILMGEVNGKCYFICHWQN